MSTLIRPDVLVVASIRRWIADDFATAATEMNLPVVHSYGLDVPDLTPWARPAWWTTTEHAARLRHAGMPMPLLSPGPTWLSTVPTHLLGRAVWSGRVADIGDGPRSGWCKPAEMKVEALPAAWWQDTRDFAAAAAAAGLLPSSAVQISPRRLTLEVEYRAFIAGRQVRALSPYLTGDGQTWSPEMGSRADLPTEAARTFAAAVSLELADNQPPAYVLDIGRTESGQWLIVEGNPAWSSATYGCAMLGVLDVVLAAADHTHTYPKWQWQPDARLTERARRSRPLARRRQG